MTTPARPPRPTRRRPDAVNPPALPELLTVADVAAQLQLDPATVRRMANRGELPAYRVGRGLRFGAEDVLAYLAGRAVGAVQLAVPPAPAVRPPLTAAEPVELPGTTTPRTSSTTRRRAAV